MGQFLSNIPQEAFLTWCVQGTMLHLPLNLSLNFFVLKQSNFEGLS